MLAVIIKVNLGRERENGAMLAIGINRTMIGLTKQIVVFLNIFK